MEIANKLDTNKIILVLLAIFMILPSTIEICGISIFKIATFIIGGICIWLWITKKENLQKSLKNIFIICNVIFALVILLSLLINIKSARFNDIFEIARYIIFAAITAIILTVCNEKKYYIFLLKVINILMIVICILGIIQYFNPFSINEMYIKSYAPTQSTTLVNDYPTPRIVGTKPNPSVYGALVALGVYFNILYYKHAKNKFIVWTSIVLCIINLMMTLTRTIQVAFVGSILLFVLISVWIKNGWKKAIKITGIAILVMFLVLLILPNSLTWRLFQVFDFSNANSWVERLDKWENYTEIINENILIGIGPVKNHVQELGYVDSEWIQVVLQYGIIGFMTYIVMLLSPFYVYWENRTNKKILKFYISLFFIILINNISSSSLISFDTAISFYLFIGLVLLNMDEKMRVEEGGFQK